MVAQVRYFTRSGNTKKLAEAVAGAAGCRAESIPEPLEGHVDVLFLGASEYAGNVSSEVKNFISSLDPEQVGEVAVFTTSAFTKKVYPKISEMLKSRGIPLAEKYYYCPGEFLTFHKGRPGRKDLEAAEEFAREVLRKLS